MCESSEDEAEIDEFETSAEKVKCFVKNLLPKTKPDEEIEHISFIRIILYAIRYDKEKKTDVCNKSEFKKTIDEKFMEQLDEEKYKFILDLQKFNNNYYKTNCFLSKHNYFLRVFELKNKFRHLTMKVQENKIFVRQISSCLTEKYNGFQAISIEFARKDGKTFEPIDIIYKPTKNPEISPLCYFTEDISKSYTNFYNQKEKFKRAHSCYEYYYCRKIFLKKDRHKRRIENCLGVPGVIYNFNTKI